MIQLDPMNILFSYFTSQCIFHGKTHPSFNFMESMDSENHGRHDKRTKYRFKILK